MYWVLILKKIKLNLQKERYMIQGKTMNLLLKMEN